MRTTQFGWVCPLEVEIPAALEMLDEEHEALPQQLGDKNGYHLGSIAGLLVGTAGEVPVKTDYGKVHLGDVVVSKLTSIHPGVIQFDHGKARTGSFVRTGALAPPPAVLLQAAQELAARRARSRRDPIIKNIERIDTSIPSLSQFRFPGMARDILYPSDYIHLKDGVSCRKCGCDPNRRIDPDSSDSNSEAEEDGEPRVVVHRGTIASGKLVIKDGKKRDQLTAEHGVLCFETEVT